MGGMCEHLGDSQWVDCVVQANRLWVDGLPGLVKDGGGGGFGLLDAIYSDGEGSSSGSCCIMSSE